MRTNTFFVPGFVAIFPFVHAVMRYGVALLFRPGPSPFLVDLEAHQFDKACKSRSLRWTAVEVAAYMGGGPL
jgi:hypothetical protein